MANMVVGAVIMVIGIVMGAIIALVGVGYSHEKKE